MSWKKNCKLFGVFPKSVDHNTDIIGHLQNLKLLSFSYEDLLEIPLQPLYDNLDSFTYEIFEKDPVKYIAYQKAIEAALIDKVPEDEIADRTVSNASFLLVKFTLLVDVFEKGYLINL